MILLAAVLPLGAVALIAGGHSWLVVAGGLLGYLVPTIIGAFRRASGKAISSYLLLVFPFGLLFWSGLVRGIWVHRRHFALNRKEGSE